MWPVGHRCPWPGCAVVVAADLWGCKAHWYEIPRALRQKLWAAYQSGQGVATASDDYRAASAAIDAWIAKQTGTAPKPAPKPQGDLPL